MKYSYLTNKIFICSTLTTFAGLAWTPPMVHYALPPGSRWCTALSLSDLDGASRSPRRISKVHHAILARFQRCTTLSSPDLDGAPRRERDSEKEAVEMENLKFSEFSEGFSILVSGGLLMIALI